MTPHDLIAGRAMLLVQRKRAEAKGQTHRLPAIDALIAAAESCIAVLEVQSRPAHAPGLVRAERRRFAPTTNNGAPGFEPTRLHRPVAHETLPATLVGAL